MKILYITTVGSTLGFFDSLIKKLIDAGNVVDIATNDTDSSVPKCFYEWGCRIYKITTSRSPINTGNIRAINQIRRIAKNYDMVHCHTPIAGIATRIACRSLRKNGCKVIYTAHGFHFYKGAPLKNWIIYYPIELVCACWTDLLITINEEDYELARNKMRAKRVEYIPGVGIDVDKFKNSVIDRHAKRQELGVPEKALLLVSIGELNANKNHQIVIRALSELKNEDIHYCIAGKGNNYDELIELSRKLNVLCQVHLLGQRNDVAEIFKASDINVFPSIREGLGLAAIEGMAAGLPLICSDNRGTRSYAINNQNSIVCSANSVKDFKNAILYFYNNNNKIYEFGVEAQKKACDFSENITNALLMNYYDELDVSLKN